MLEDDRIHHIRGIQINMCHGLVTVQHLTQGMYDEIRWTWEGVLRRALTRLLSIRSATHHQASKGVTVLYLLRVTKA